MNTTTVIAIVVFIAIAIACVAAAIYLQNRRTQSLRARFGDEYDRTLNESRGRAEAEAALEQRRKRVERLRIRPLSAADSARFTAAWHEVQAHFVDDPDRAVTEADRLLGEVMSARGYPVSDFNQRAADISVDHPRVVEHYRAAHEIEVRHVKGEASTEDLRQAMIHYRTLFADLVGEPVTPDSKLPHAA